MFQVEVADKIVMQFMNDGITLCILQFLIELSLIEVEDFLVYRPSIIAASAIVIARCVLHVQDPWVSHMAINRLKWLAYGHKKKESPFSFAIYS